MSTEVEGKCARTPGGESHHNKPEERVHVPAEQNPEPPGPPPGGPDPDRDPNKRSQENDKENERETVEVGETARRKVVDAPPPRVNAWAKRTTGRAPHGTGGLGSHDKGNAPCF